jgi:WD domain, G-beta repeat
MAAARRGRAMTRSRLLTALALATLPAANLAALPFPKAPIPIPHLPEGAVRRFGDAPPAPPAGKRAKMVFDDGDVINLAASPRAAVMAQTPDGRRLVVGDATGRIDVFDIATGRLVRRLREPSKDAVYSLAVSPDGRRLAVGRTKPDVQLWDLTAGRVERIIPLAAAAGERALPERLVFSPDGKVLYTGIDLFTGATDRGDTTWEVSSGKRLWNNAEVGYNLAADPRGRWVLTGVIGSGPAGLALLDASTGRLARGMAVEPSWEADGAGGHAVDASWTLDRRFTPDGSRLVTAHGDGTARVWDPMAGKELVRMKWGRDRTSQPGGLAVSADGKWAAIRHGRQVLVWELSSGLAVHTIGDLESPPRELAFTHDGRGLIASDGPSPILWTLVPKDLPHSGGSADALWATLGSEDATAAYRLQWALVGDPKAAVRLFSARVKPADLVLPRPRFDRLVAALDSAEFGQRERAERELTGAGIAVPGAWLRQALAAATSEEVQARLRRVLSRSEAPSPARWRLERAVQVLELAGTPEAAALLTEWAGGPAGGLLTDEAAAAWARVRARR